MTSPNSPLDYERPNRPNRTGANFGFGLFTGLVASGIAWGTAYAAQDGRVKLIALIVLLVGKISFAAYFSSTGRRPGFALGLLLSVGIVCLILGGLCFAALRNI